MGRVRRLPDNLHVEVHLRVLALKQGSGGIGHVHFGEQGARVRIDGIGGAHHLAAEFASGNSVSSQAGLQAHANGGSVGLRHGNVDAQRIGLRQVEHFLAGGAAVAGIDQRADIDVALR